MNLGQLHQRLLFEGVPVELSIRIDPDDFPQETIMLVCRMGDEIKIHKRVKVSMTADDSTRNNIIDWAVASLVATTIPHYCKSEQLKRDASNQQS